MELINNKLVLSFKDLKYFNMTEGSYYLQKVKVEEGNFFGTAHGQGDMTVLFENFKDAEAYFEEKRIKWEV
jgi:hypothetical protein